jgi:hypothetical protein
MQICPHLRKSKITIINTQRASFLLIEMQHLLIEDHFSLTATITTVINYSLHAEYSLVINFSDTS